MTKPHNNSDALDELKELLAALVLKDISDSKLERLNDLMISDIELRQYALEYLEQETILQHHFDLVGRIANLHSMPEEPPTSDSQSAPLVVESSLLPSDVLSNVGRSSNWYSNHFIVALGACLLVVVGWIGKDAFLSTQENGNELAQSVASVTDSSQAIWTSNSPYALPNAPVQIGDTLTLSNGLTELYFDCGAKVILKGPAKLEILSPMRAELHHGTLTALVEESAHGFRIDTPNTKVTDLGTEFGVSVDEQGTTDMVVFSGKVAMEYALASPDVLDTFVPSYGELTAEEAKELESFSLPRESRLFTEGKALRITSDGTIERIVSVSKSDYPLSSELPSNTKIEATNKLTNVIESVTDNLSGDETISYYQIVHRGFGEDVRAFVGKSKSQWNGLTREHGLPEVLKGADYIKTFCDSGIADSIKIKVRLNQASRLFVLFNNQLELPPWLQEEFKDTGYDIGLDEASAGRWQRIGKGPGSRLDGACSVWFKDIFGPENVVLGSLMPSAENSLMYGIAAVPLAIAENTPVEPAYYHEPRLGTRLTIEEHLPVPLAETKIEIKKQFNQLTLAVPATDDVAALSKGQSFRAETLGGKIRPHKDVKLVDGTMPAINDGLIARNNDDIERNAWYNAHGRFSLDLGRSVEIESINCFSWHRTYRARQYFTVWGSNADEMPEVGFRNDEEAEGWDYIGMVYTPDQKKYYNTVQASSLQVPTGSLGPYRHLLWVTEAPTFFTEIDVHEVP